MLTPLMTLIMQTDSYKTSHFTQYPEGTTRVSSYIEARGGDYDETVFFGLQAFIKEYMQTPLTKTDVMLASTLMASHGVPFNYDGWMRIVTEHGGLLPLEINAVAEGTVMATGNVQVQVVNTDPNLPWLTSYMETALLRAVWYPSTVATLSREVKKVIFKSLQVTADDPDAALPFKLHDFGARGATTSEAAVIGGMAHLVNFLGTDTLAGLVGAMAYYNTSTAVGHSIPATEHSTVTSWGRDGEIAMVANLLEKNPTGLVACVIDSYDAEHFASHILGEVHKDAIMARDGTFVARPDSGDPVEMPIKIIEILMEKFGYTTNAKGFKILPSQIRVLQGDGMDVTKIKRLLATMIERGLDVDNVAVGMGGGLLQKVDRDTCKYAMKCSAIEVKGAWQDVYKDPITDKGKRSKRGVLALVKRDGVLKTVRDSDRVRGAHGKEKNYLVPYYLDGAVLCDYTFESVRERAAL